MKRTSSMAAVAAFALVAVGCSRNRPDDHPQAPPAETKTTSGTTTSQETEAVGTTTTTGATGVTPGGAIEPTPTAEPTARDFNGRDAGDPTGVGRAKGLTKPTPPDRTGARGHPE
jgi:hypothetical protein